ncbi:MAG: phage tail sheath subtilisin-like domain-containing protein [Ardenticatenaceae bacterium]|nr:phage tail sheath subtilisin-like domain-containing protein [Ardenticatenaceae bacterium]
MAEMILPGTYIEVRAEKLIAAGPIAIGNVGIVGTARRGVVGQVYNPSNIGEARDIFGEADDYANPIEAGRELTLVRALELVYANGGQRVFAVRVAADGQTAAVYSLPASTGNVTATAEAIGDGYNDFTFEIAENSDDNTLRDVTISAGFLTESYREVPQAVADFVGVLNGDSTTYNYRRNSSTGEGSLLFTFDVAGATGDVTAGTVDPPPGTLGTNGAAADSNNYEDGLAALTNQDVHIIVMAGFDAAVSLATHVDNASSDLMRRERIGVTGSTNSDDLTDLLSAPDNLNGRLVYVGPGLKTDDPVSGKEVALPASYAAAAVAGLLSSLDPHFSPTNKIIKAIGVETIFNGTELEQLLLNRVMALEERNGSVRVVRGITSSTNTAWSQVTTRRIVDFAKFGVRSAANPFIGKLNNERVRQALKGSINGFLADMVDREMLISYELEVSATREQEIRGIAQVTMIVRPTFSIDFIRVTMFLE